MERFSFNISLSVLNHLGRNLYRNFITVLGEAISNSWDADAKEVRIYIDKEQRSLAIKDNGIGMTSEDFQEKFLKIGYTKRKNNKNTSVSGRPFIGRKGIGKLALLSCAEKIHILTKTATTEFVGGVIDNAGLDEAITEDLNPQQYPLEEVDSDFLNMYSSDMVSGTILYFENVKIDVANTINYIRKQVALFFRFALIDESFKIFINDEEITLEQLRDLAEKTQFVWQINDFSDPYLSKYVYPNKDSKGYDRLFSLKGGIKGFIASVERPQDRNIRGLSERVSLDLFVNGRLRERDLLKHIQRSRVVENYLYGQIHFDALDDENDRFTSSREAVIENDPLFKHL